MVSCLLEGTPVVESLAAEAPAVRRFAGDAVFHVSLRSASQCSPSCPGGSPHLSSTFRRTTLVLVPLAGWVMTRIARSPQVSTVHRVPEVALPGNYSTL